MRVRKMNEMKKKKSFLEGKLIKMIFFNGSEFGMIITAFNFAVFFFFFSFLNKIYQPDRFISAMLDAQTDLLPSQMYLSTSN